MRKLILNILLLICGASLLSAQDRDSLSVNDKVVMIEDPLNVEYRTVEQVFPAMMILSPFASHTDVSTGFEHRKESEALIQEEGKGWTAGVFNANSFIRLGTSTCARGSAQYSRAIRRDVYMNETTDYLLLRPYVLTDTLSGNLQHESYRFSGGCSHIHNGVIYDIGGEYRATHEYRSVDPRPRNIASDLKATASIGWSRDRFSILGLVGYRRYRQSQSVVFLNQAGANTVLFHATGLGHDYYRFRSTGVFASTRYSSDGFNAGLYAKDSKHNLCAGVRYDFLSTTRFLTNQNDAPLTVLRAHTVNAFLTSRPAERIALTMDVAYERKLGSENVIDCAASGFYKDLLAMDMYSSHRLWARMSSTFRTGRLHFTPELTYYFAAESYAYPAAQSRMSVAFADIDMRYTCSRGSWFFTPSLKGGIGSGYALCEFNGYFQKSLRRDLALFARSKLGLLTFGSGEYAYALNFTIGITY